VSRELLRVVRDEPALPADAASSGTLPPDADVSRALRDLISRFDAFIRRTASRHGLRGADLDEVVQDLHLRIWRSFGTSELIRRAKPAYMYRAAVSASLDIIRRRRALKSQATRLEDAPAEHLSDRRPGVVDRLEGDDVARAVHESLSQLQESRRAVVRMYLAGYDRFEIADLLGWTEGKTRNLLYRGLEDLRQVLAARGITRDSP
jgi:RNA polymerase sigma-70 factor (ECF subfamily)